MTDDNNLPIIFHILRKSCFVSKVMLATQKKTCYNALQYKRDEIRNETESVTVFC